MSRWVVGDKDSTDHLWLFHGLKSAPDDPALRAPCGCGPIFRDLILAKDAGHASLSVARCSQIIGSCRAALDRMDG